jgi:hypothetical protein
VSSDEVSLFDVSFLLGSSGFNELSGSLEAPQKPQNKPLIKPNNQTPNKKDGSVVIYKVGTE